MRISSFNINKFCGPYSLKGQYYNPKNVDFKTPIKEIVDDLLKNKDDIFFLQEFTDNRKIGVKELFSEEKFKIFNDDPLTKSNVVAITLENSAWVKKEQAEGTEFTNKFLEMELNKHELSIVSFHNTDEKIKNKVQKIFDDTNNNIDVIIGDFNDIEWIRCLEEGNDYIDLVTNNMITFKPAQTAIDRIFVKNKEKFIDKIVFNGIVETFLSDHNLLTFSLNI